MAALSQPDAAMYWRSLHSANDQFLLYAFDADDGSGVRDLAELRARAERIADLHLRIERAPADLGYPRWVRAAIADAQWHRHDVVDWVECLAAVASLMTPGSREPEYLWRVHLFGPLTGAPESDGAAMVVVMQISHALGDGRTVSAIARRLLSDGPTDRPQCSLALPGSLVAGLGAVSAMPRLAAATAVGLAAWRFEEPTAEVPSIEATALNLPGDGPTELRTLTVPREGLRRLAPSVTAAVLTALADVLPGCAGADSDGRVVAEVTVAREPIAGQRNNFHTVAIDCRSDLGGADRAVAITDELVDARRRDSALARRLSRRAAALGPAVLESTAVRLAARAPLPTQVAGATVVSSVNRGAADLMLGGRRVLFTAGFPALSPVHGLTHGVHGIGDRITVSLAARGRAAADLDGYVEALRTALS